MNPSGLTLLHLCSTAPMASLSTALRWWKTSPRSNAPRRRRFSGQKLESVGTLAGGIAHDFNNLLGAVQSQTELALEELGTGSSCHEELKTVRDVAMRGSEIVRQLMIYAGKESGDLGLVDLSKTVDEMLSLLKVSVAKPSVIEAYLDGDLPAIQASAAELRQIVMNLITNASDTIEDRDVVIRVITRRVALQGQSAANPCSVLADGDYVQLEVSDTGRGMSPQTQAKVFDPFFTTKSAGRGLGLAVVHGIVRNLGGAIHLASEPDNFSSIGRTAFILQNSVVSATFVRFRHHPWLPPAKHTKETVLPTANQKSPDDRQRLFTGSPIVQARHEHTGAQLCPSNA